MVCARFIPQDRPGVCLSWVQVASLLTAVSSPHLLVNKTPRLAPLAGGSDYTNKRSKPGSFSCTFRLLSDRRARIVSIAPNLPVGAFCGAGLQDILLSAIPIVNNSIFDKRYLLQ